MPNPSILAEAEAEAPTNTAGGVWSHSRAGGTGDVKPFFRPYTVVYADGTIEHIQVLNGTDWREKAEGLKLGRRVVFAASGHLDSIHGR